MKSRGTTIGLGKRLLFVLILAFIGLLLFEVVARLTLPEFNLNNNWKYHLVLGWSQVPGGEYDYEREGRTVHVEFNSLGFRDVAHEVESPPESSALSSSEIPIANRCRSISKRPSSSA